MIYKNLKEALDSRDRYILVDDNDKFLKHFRKWDFFKNQDEFNHREFGKFFLYEEVTSGGRKKARINYPKLALFINELVVDQAIQVDYVDYTPRTWEINSEYTIYHDGKPYEWPVHDRESKINSTILWGDTNLLVYGAWLGMPNWKQLKVAYQKSWWFHREIDEMRDLKLKDLLR
jgi:hypothetical protein